MFAQITIVGTVIIEPTEDKDERVVGFCIEPEELCHSKYHHHVIVLDPEKWEEKLQYCLVGSKVLIQGLYEIRPDIPMPVIYIKTQG